MIALLQEQKLYQEWDKSQKIAIQGDKAELDREKDKDSDETPDAKAKKVDKVEKETTKQTKGFFSKLLGKFSGGGFMMGAGALMGGMGVLAGGAGYLLSELNDFDGKKIRENVKELFGISEDVGGKGEFFLEGGTFMLAMTGIGIGLAAFSVGALVAAAVDKFSGDGQWTQNIVDNVDTLLGMAGGTIGSNAALLGSSLVFGSAMAVIGAGLLAFSIGATTGTIAAGMDEALKKFSGGTSWSQNIVDNVETLLGIVSGGFWANAGILGKGAVLGTALAVIGAGLFAFSIGATTGTAAAGMDVALQKFSGGTTFSENIVTNVETLLGLGGSGFWSGVGLLFGAAGFAAAMGAVGAGILAFSIGGAAGTTVAAMDSVYKNFSGESFATNIKKNVIELLSIKDSLGGNLKMLTDSAFFVAAMTGVGAGLLAFSIGKAGSGIAEVITQFSGADFAGTIKDNVVDLLSIGSLEGVNIGAATDFAAVMGILAGGVLAFSVTKGFDALVGVGAGILNFFSGNESPVGEMLKIADKADDLDKAGTALNKLSGALKKMTMLKFSGIDFEFQKFASDLAWGVKGIHVAMYGGTFDPPGWGGDNSKVKIDAGKGLASIEQLDFENAGSGITILNRALNNWDGNTTKGGGSGGEGTATVGDISSIDDHSTKVIINQAPEVVSFENRAVGADGQIYSW